jgi:FAD synthetase
VEECALDDWRAPLLPGPRPSPAAVAPLPPGALVARPPRSPLDESVASTSAPTAPPVVALGKFDALHRGHAALATGAAALGGSPWLISFSGMAGVLGWAPRRPLVAPVDRARVLRSWAAGCGGPPPRERTIPFASVRALSPAAFVDVLARDLGAAGVVVGEGYRFGHRAAGDAALLRSAGAAAGMVVAVLPLVPQQDSGGDGCDQPPVSSSAVRAALAAGDVAGVAALLGRRHRVVAAVAGPALAKAAAAAAGGSARLHVPAAALANEAPGPGVYGGVAVAVGREVPGPDAAWTQAGVGRVSVLPGGSLEVELAGGEEGGGDGGWAGPAVLAAVAGAGPSVLVALDF